MATTGSSPLKPSEVALLEAESVEALLAAPPDRWLPLRRSSAEEVRAAVLRYRQHCQTARALVVTSQAEWMAKFWLPSSVAREPRQ